MKRRTLLAGLAGATALAWWAKPRDRGAPYDDYFRALNAELKRNGPARPSLVLDLDRLDHNIAVLRQSIQRPKHYRVVAKSLPSQKLIEYILAKAQTNRLMAFHQPFLNLQARAFATADILLGKPLPVRSAAIFYAQHKGDFDPARQLQWLLDTPQRLAQYLELAQGQTLKLRVNIEIDVGLHRGGVADSASLAEMLKLIQQHPGRLEFAGFMGYDPHVVKVPARDTAFAASRRQYQQFVDLVRSDFPHLWREDLTLNGAGSPTYRLYETDTLCNDLAVGSGLVKPTDFDVATLAEHRPAAFIATPILKVLEGTRIPALEWTSPLIAAWDPNRAQTCFIYGGRWMAQLESPAGLNHNGVYGFSSNQEFVNASRRSGLAVDDHVFLRPTQSEALMLQFGDLVVLRGGKVIDAWPVFG